MSERTTILLVSFLFGVIVGVVPSRSILLAVSSLVSLFGSIYVLASGYSRGVHDAATLVWLAGMIVGCLVTAALRRRRRRRLQSMQSNVIDSMGTQ
jgi:hypothetical protein